MIRGGFTGKILRVDLTKGIIKDDASIFGLPKFKIVRTKIKKDKAEDKPKEGEVAATEKVTTGKEAAPKADKEKKTKGK